MIQSILIIFWGYQLRIIVTQQMELGNNKFNFPQLPSLKQQSGLQSQIKRILNVIIPQRQGYIIRQFENCLEFCLRKKDENSVDFPLIYSIEIKQSYFAISCSLSLTPFLQIIKNKGYYHFLTLFNDWNMKNGNGQKIIWCEDQKIIKIKTSNLLMQKKHNNLQSLSYHLDSIGQEMITFVGLLSPKFQRIRDNKKVGKYVWKNYKSCEEVQGLKSLQVAFQEFLKFNYEVSTYDESSEIVIQEQQSFQKTLNENKNSVGTFGKLKEKITQYLLERYKNPQIKKQSSPKRIVEYVRVISQQQRKIQMQFLSTSCEIQSFLFQYEIFPNSSYFEGTNQLIQQKVRQYFQSYQQGNKKTQSKGRQIKQVHIEGSQQTNQVKVNQILLQKIALKDDIIPFQNEKLTLLCIRSVYCEQIAQYYLESISSISQINRILIRPYQKLINVNFNLNTKLILLFRIALALYFIHCYKITHRDLKPPNIPLDNNLMPKMIDFGSACFTKLARSECQSYNVPPLRTTRHYNKFYSELSFQIADMISKKQYQTHELFDVHAFGRIAEKLLNDETSRKYLGETGYDFVTFLINKCTQPNPNMRLTPYMIILFLAQMQITKLSTILATRPIKTKKIS